MKEKNSYSLKLNMILNAIKGIMGILFPLITFPYVSRILGVENIGRYNFSLSMINYFLLISGLGINSYAIREGAKVRNNSIKFKRFADEMLTINALSTVAAYILLGITYVVSVKLHDYTSLLLILSLQIIFRTIGIEWVYSIYEDYAYITLRSILFQAISLICLFLFVKEPEDLNVYAGITVLSAVGSNVLNYVHAKKYCKVGLTKDIDWARHMKPILVLFAMMVTVTIYTNFGTTLLGYLCSDAVVGIYAVSTKMYTIIKTILSSVLIVALPRLSALIGTKNYSVFNETASDIYRTLITIVLPTITGVVLMAEEIVLILSDVSFVGATPSLQLLGIALFFCLGSWFWGQCILVPVKMENEVLKATIVSAASYIAICFFLIPVWQEKAAALATVVAEAISFLWCSVKGHKYAILTQIIKTYLKSIVGCAVIVVIVCVGKIVFDSLLLRLVLIVPIAVIAYFTTEIIIKNKAVYGIMEMVRRKTVKH